MTYALLTFIVVADIAITAVIFMGIESLVTGMHPWHYRRYWQAKKLRAYQERVSDMEHEFGIFPCSLPQCFTCRYRAGATMFSPASAPGEVTSR